MHVLVTVGSRHGSTREIGTQIARVLQRETHTVELVDPDDVTGLVGFDAVVLGSAVYVGRLTESVRALERRLGGALAEVPVWLFWSGPIGDPPHPVPEPDDVAYLVRRLGPRGVRVFAGRLDLPGLEMAERALVAAVGPVSGDHRDIDDIDRWAGSIAAELRPRGRARAGVMHAPSGQWRGLGPA